MSVFYRNRDSETRERGKDYAKCDVKKSDSDAAAGIWRAADERSGRM